MTEPAHTSSLAAINSKINAEGEVLPAVQPKDGTRMQTGTVATMLHNIGLYNAGKRDQVERELEAAIPTLLKVGPFSLFAPDAWIAGDNPERRFVGERAKAWLDTQEVLK